MIRNVMLIGSAVLILVVIVASLVPGGWRPHTPLHTTFEHFLAYGLVSFWFTIVLRRLWMRLLAAFGLVVLSTLMELAQMFIPRRGAALVDIYFSAAGVGAGLMGGLVLMGLIALATGALSRTGEASHVIRSRDN